MWNECNTLEHGIYRSEMFQARICYVCRIRKKSPQNFVNVGLKNRKSQVSLDECLVERISLTNTRVQLFKSVYEDEVYRSSHTWKALSLSWKYLTINVKILGISKKCTFRFQVFLNNFSVVLSSLQLLKFVKISKTNSI